MPRKNLRNNYRVEITPRTTAFGIVVGDEKDACEKIVEQVRRHVDDVASVYVVSDDASVCEFCGRRWTEDDALYNGGCCDEDQKREDDRWEKMQRKTDSE